MASQRFLQHGLSVLSVFMSARVGVALVVTVVACASQAQHRPGWTTEMLALETQCQARSASACGDLGEALLHTKVDGDDERGLVLLEVACGMSDQSSCTRLGEIYGRHFRGEGAAARASSLLMVSCKRGVGAACTSAAVLAARQGDEEAAKQLLGTACNLGDAEGCEQLGFAEKDELSGNPRRAEDALATACKGGQLSACHDIALGRLKKADTRTEGLGLLKDNCQRGHAPSCLSAALESAPTLSQNADCAAARPLAERACAEKDRNGCAIVVACGGRDNISASQASLTKDCEKGVALACFYWAEGARSASGDADGRVRGAYRIACREAPSERAATVACGRFGAYELSRAITKPEKVQAEQLLDRACEESSAQACCDLANAVEADADRPWKRERAADLRTKACELGEARCCGKKPPK